MASWPSASETEREGNDYYDYDAFDLLNLMDNSSFFLRFVFVLWCGE